MLLLEDQCCNFIFFSRLSDQVTMTNPGVLAVHAFQVPFGLPEPMNLSEGSAPRCPSAPCFIRTLSAKQD